MEKQIAKKVDELNHLLKENRIHFHQYQRCIQYVSNKTIPPKERLQSINHTVEVMLTKIKAKNKRIEEQIAKKLNTFTATI